MLLNPLLAQMQAEERVRDALREAEQARLVREAQPELTTWSAIPRSCQPWRPPVWPV